MVNIDDDSLPVLVYFAVLISAFLNVVAKWPPLRTSILLAIIVLLFALNALRVCWGAIFQFMMSVSKEKGCGPGNSPMELLSCSTKAWQETDVFVQAYVEVTNTKIGWMSSSQLLLFVLSGCTFLHMESARLEIPRLLLLSYIIVGFLGAISLSFPLFFAHAYVIAKEAKRERVVANISLILILSNILAFCGILLLPLTYETYRHTIYTWALLLVHFILGLPCFVGSPVTTKGITDRTQERQARIKLASTYIFIAGCSAAIHFNNFIQAVLEIDRDKQNLVIAFIHGVFASSCQLSITYDVIFTSIAAMVYMCSMEFKPGLAAAFLTPILSIATTFPLYLAFCEFKKLFIGSEKKTE